jgi:hypothetical protein
MRILTYIKSRNETFLVAMVLAALLLVVVGFRMNYLSRHIDDCEYGEKQYPAGFRTEGAGIMNLCLPEPDRPLQDGICRDNDENTPVFECQKGEWVVLDS